MSNKKPSQKKHSHKKKYIKPQVTQIGSIQEISQTESKGGKADGGAFPANKHMCLTPPLPIEEHRILLADHACQSSYKEEIEKAVKDGDVVLDLGTGTGIHAVFALQAGAKKVYAVDSHGVIQLAKKVINENGFEDQVIFLKEYSRNLKLPEKVDVIISNIGFLHTLNDLPLAVRDFLKPGGRVVPDAAELSLTPIMDQHFYETNINNWSKNSYGINFEAFRQLATAHPQYLELDPEAFLAEAANMGRIDFKQPVAKVLTWKQDFEVTKSGDCHGIGGWYSFFHNKNSFLSTEPPMKLARELWQNFIFPTDKPIQVKKGDKLSLHLEMHREMLEDAPIWNWKITKNNTLIVQQSSFQSFLI